MAQQSSKRSGHKSRSIMKSTHTKGKSRKHVKILKTKRHPTKQQLKDMQKDAALSRKLFYNMITEKSRTKGPTYENAMKLLELGKKSYKKGEYGKAILYNTMASAYFFSNNPAAPTAIEHGRLGVPRKGIHAVEDPDTMVKWGTLPPITEKLKLSRKERRRTKGRGKGRGKKRRRTKRR